MVNSIHIEVNLLEDFSGLPQLGFGKFLSDPLSVRLQI